MCRGRTSTWVARSQPGFPAASHRSRRRTRIRPRPLPARPSGGQLAAAASAWDALRRPEPSALAEYATTGVSQLPFLSPALQRLLEELPAPATACPEQNGGRCRRSRRARRVQRRRSVPRRTSRRRRSSATPGSTARSPISAAARRARSKPRPATRSVSPAAGRRPRLRRVGTHADPQRRARPQTEGRPHNTPRRRPLGRRNAHHPPHHVAMGPSRANAHSTCLRPN